MANKFLKSAAVVEAERAAQFTARRLGLPSSSVTTTMPSPDATRLPDGSWMKNEDMESIRAKDPDAYKLIMGQGYEAYQQSYEKALNELGPYKIEGKEDQYDLGKAIRDKVNKDYLNLVFGKETVEQLPAKIEQSLDAGLKQARAEAERINAEVNQQMLARGQKTGFGATLMPVATPEEETKVAEANRAIAQDDYVRKLANQEKISLDKALAVWEEREAYVQRRAAETSSPAGIFEAAFDKGREVGVPPEQYGKFEYYGGGGDYYGVVTPGQVQEQARKQGYNMPLQLAQVVAQGLTAQGVIAGTYGGFVSGKIGPGTKGAIAPVTTARPSHDPRRGKNP